MIKSQLVEILSKYPADPPLATINRIFRSINAALLMGQKVKIAGFGTFRLKKITYNTVYDFKNKTRVGPFIKWQILFKPSPSMDQLIRRRKEKI